MEGVKTEKMPITSYTDQPKAQCVFWTVERHGSTAIQRTFFTKYHLPGPSRRTIILWWQLNRNRGSHSLRGVVERQQAARKAKTDWRDVSSRSKMFSMRSWSLSWGVSHNRMACCKQEIEKVSFPFPDWTTTVRHKEDKSCCFCSALSGEAGGKCSLQLIVFSDECSFSLQGAMNKQNCRGSVLPNAQTLSTSHCRALQR